MAKYCRGISSGGERCNARPVRESDFCFWHDPEHAAEATEARRLGGLRRKREATVQGAYNIDGVGSVEDLQGILVSVIVDLYSLENTVARNRTIIGALGVAARLLEVGDQAQQLDALESVLGPRVTQVPSRSRRWNS